MIKLFFSRLYPCLTFSFQMKLDRLVCIVLVLFVFTPVTGVPNILQSTSNLSRLEAIRAYFNSRLRYMEIIVFLPLSHGIKLSLRQLQIPITLKICPRLLRCNCGTENAKLAQLQPLFRYNDMDSMSGIRSFMYGKSVSNQRIESWWGILRRQGIQW